MVEGGVFDEREGKIELEGGSIIEVAPPGPEHAVSNIELYDLMKASLQGLPCRVCFGTGIPLPPDGTKYPDVCVLQGGRDRYRHNWAEPKDVLLVVEVAYTTLESDMQKKGLLYAQAGIPEYWLVDVSGEVTVKKTQPTNQGYRRAKAHVETIAMDAFPERVMRFTHIF